MFNNIHEKIKWLAKILFALTLVLGIILFIRFCVIGTVGMGLLAIGVVVISGYTSAILIYAFGETIENTSKLKENTKEIKSELSIIRQKLKDMQ